MDEDVQEEVEALQHIYPGLVTVEDSARGVIVRLVIEEVEGLRLSFLLPPNYPAEVPAVFVEWDGHETTKLSDALNAEATRHIGTVMIFSLASLCSELCQQDDSPDVRSSATVAEASGLERSGSIEVGRDMGVDWTTLLASLQTAGFTEAGSLHFHAKERLTVRHDGDSIQVSADDISEEDVAGAVQVLLLAEPAEFGPRLVAWVQTTRSADESGFIGDGGIPCALAWQPLRILADLRHARPR